ncbi:hypothetical protein C2E23DRAFT_198660 [Lenzites betulinus]|nr:hypothetical protein C2E23DRAFT_198660 [Lenzites betulinus]
MARILPRRRPARVLVRLVLSASNLLFLNAIPSAPDRVCAGAAGAPRDAANTDVSSISSYFDDACAESREMEGPSLGIKACRHSHVLGDSISSRPTELVAQAHPNRTSCTSLWQTLCSTLFPRAASLISPELWR